MLSGVLNVLKPPGMTSHDVVSFVRKATAVKRVGHAGTLDPDAAGVLPVFVGKATRLIEYTITTDKCYRAQLLFGIKTDTGDDSGNITEEKDLPQVTGQDIERILTKFTGCIHQIPPMYSAIKQQGRKLYQLAREGKNVERQARLVKVYGISILRRTKDSLLLDIHCSKGTYIRSLLEDIAEGLGSVGTMNFLLRTKAGGFTIENSRLLDEVQNNPAACLLPFDISIKHLPRIDLNSRQAEYFCQGRPVVLPLAAVGDARVYAGEFFLGIGRTDGQKLCGKKVFTDIVPVI